MLKQFSKLSFATFSFLLMSFSLASTADDSIDQLLKVSGIEDQVAQFPALIKQGMQQAKQQGTPIPETEFNSLLEAVDTTILASDIIAGIREQLETTLDQKETLKILAWYDTDLGKEITKHEKGASTPEALQEMMQSAETLLQDTERVEFANKVNELVGATDMAMELQRSSNIAIYTAIFTAMEPEAELDLAPILAQMDSVKDQMLAATNQMITVSFVYAYKNLEIEKLNSYETFLNDTTTMKFNDAALDSMSRGFGSSIEKWAGAIAQIMKQNK